MPVVCGKARKTASVLKTPLVWASLSCGWLWAPALATWPCQVGKRQEEYGISTRRVGLLTLWINTLPLILTSCRERHWYKKLKRSLRAEKQSKLPNHTLLLNKNCFLWSGYLRMGAVFPFGKKGFKQKRKYSIHFLLFPRQCPCLGVKVIYLHGYIAINI